MRHALRSVSAALLIVGAVSAKAEPLAETAPHFVEAQCPPAMLRSGREVVCGSLRVPQDRIAVAGLQITLPIVIVRARAPKPGLPPVIYLHGGPGGGVVRELASSLDTPIGRELIAQDQDWVFFDQRGADMAKPSLDCGDLALNDAGPANEKVVAALIDCAGRQTASGIDFRFYTSVDVVRDVQDIRRALGFSSFDVYGFSYGTRSALSALVHASEGMRAVVLDSPWPPEARWAEPMPGWISRQVRDLLLQCAEDRVCARYGDLRSGLDALMRRMMEQPVRIGKRTYTADMMALFLMDALYDGPAVRAFPRTVSRFIAGDMRALDGYAVDIGADYAEALHMATLCNEEFPFEQVQAVWAGATGDAIAEAIAATLVNYFPACKAFNSGVADPIEQAPVHSALPVLFLAAGIDAGCPAELSEAAVKNFPNGQMAIARRSTHGVARNSACGRRVARAFLQSPRAVLDLDCFRDEDVAVRFR